MTAEQRQEAWIERVVPGTDEFSKVDRQIVRIYHRDVLHGDERVVEPGAYYPPDLAKLDLVQRQMAEALIRSRPELKALVDRQHASQGRHRYSSPTS